MNNISILFVSAFLFCTTTLAQNIENIEYVADFSDGLAAVKKENQWGFINALGELTIPFRNDLVPTQTQEGTYPIFKDGRCLIKKQYDGITYFGFIDTSGKTVVEPQFLNASNFKNHEAIALLLLREEVGENEVLGKKIVYYKYFEITIDSMGTTKNYLTPKGFNVVLDKQHLKNPPRITSRPLAENLYAILNNNKWTILNVKKQNEN